MAKVLKEYRCYINKYLLCKAHGNGQVEIVNPSNRVINYMGPRRKSQEIGPKGDNFATYSMECRCENCNRLLGRAFGTDLLVEIKCHTCKAMNLFDIERHNRFRYAGIPDLQRTRIFQQIENLLDSE